RLQSYPAAALAVCIGAIFICMFVRRQRRAATPLIDFSLFRNRRFRAGVAAAMTAAVALIGIELVFSQRLQLVLSMSPLQAGLAILPIPIASFIAGPLAGIALPRMGNEKVMW